MSKTLTKTLTAALLSVSLAVGTVGASAAPARAENTNEVAAILGGLLALYAIGRAIDSHNDRQASPPAHQPPRTNPRVAPAACFIQGQDRGQPYRGYVRRCMQNQVARPNLLPDRCLRLVHTPRGPRNIYGGRCLAQNGWMRG